MFLVLLQSRVTNNNIGKFWLIVKNNSSTLSSWDTVESSV